LNEVAMAESIGTELEALESIGRVSVSGQREVHAEFGFGQMRRKEKADPAERAPDATPPTGEVAGDIDEAFTRLKARASLA
jgi:hypothetical protein